MKKRTDLVSQVRACELRILKHTLEVSGGKNNAAAKRLGMSPANFRRKLREHGFPAKAAGRPKGT